jgi:hypothetical protein
MADKPKFVVELVAEPPAASAVRRLRRFLKAALRCYGLRCVDLREVSPGAAPAKEDEAHE